MTVFFYLSLKYLILLNYLLALKISSKSKLPLNLFPFSCEINLKKSKMNSFSFFKQYILNTFYLSPTIFKKILSP